MKSWTSAHMYKAPKEHHSFEGHPDITIAFPGVLIMGLTPLYREQALGVSGHTKGVRELINLSTIVSLNY